MNFIRTVFVLGAGASIPYGFPSGTELIEQIVNHSLTDPDWRTIYTRCAFTEEQISTFAYELQYSQQSSIDSFLMYRKEYLRIGKLAIAICINSKEDPKYLGAFEVRRTGCYQYIFNIINENIYEIDPGAITFLTFYYDRSLEQFFYIAYRNSRNIPGEEIIKLMEKTPIYHLHGSLGNLLWQDYKGHAYERTYSSKELTTMAQSITVIEEDKNFQNKLVLEDKGSLTFSKQICFLGFGYHKNNLELINPPNLRITSPKIIKFYEKNRVMFDQNRRYVIGSGFGMEPAQIEQISQKWSISFPNPQVDALSFLKNYVTLFD